MTCTDVYIQVDMMLTILTRSWSSTLTPRTGAWLATCWSQDTTTLSPPSTLKMSRIIAFNLYINHKCDPFSFFVLDNPIQFQFSNSIQFKFFFLFSDMTLYMSSRESAILTEDRVDSAAPWICSWALGRGGGHRNNGNMFSVLDHHTLYAS